MLVRGDVVKIMLETPIWEQDPHSDDEIEVCRFGQLAVVIEGNDDTTGTVDVYTLEEYLPDNRGTVANHLFFRPDFLQKVARLTDPESVYDIVYQTDKLRVIIDTAP